ncbi:hypothetical protein [Saccharopolyspora hattusasensis]|uniref:hypothetical protein n=1 Tax=Saccharopolyspora hattusasensis TaxID=1128679 RepID=UPI003D962C85
MSRSKNHPPESRERAVRKAAEARGEHAPQRSAMQALADPPGVGTAETARRWVRHSETDTAARAGVASEKSAESQRLRQENTELKRDNAILTATSAFFAVETDRPHR